MWHGTVDRVGEKRVWLTQARGLHCEGAINARLAALAPAGGHAAAAGTDSEVRRVCLAFESVEVGQHMLAWATKYCLFPDDEVYIVHCFSKVRRYPTWQKMEYGVLCPGYACGGTGQTRDI